MKKLIALPCALAFAAALSAVAACGAGTREGEEEFFAYTLSDVVMTQLGVNTYEFALSADCTGDNADVYLTENDRITSSDKPVAVQSAADGELTRFTFEADLQLSEEYYLWVVGEDKEVMLPVTAPSMFPSMEERVSGGALFHFAYTAGVSWSSFCDPAGKSVWVSDKPVYDETASVVQKDIPITDGECIIPQSSFGEDKYYYSVTTAKNGLLTIISCPVTLSSSVYEQFTDIGAGLDGDARLTVTVGVAADSEIAAGSAADLQLVVKSGAGDEIYSADSVWENGVAKMTFDCTLLLEADLWYDMCLAYRGAIVCDVPKLFGSSEVREGSNVTIDGVNYCITDWKPDGAPDSDAALKVYFEENTTEYADSYCSSYVVTLADGDKLELTVRVKVKSGLAAVPELAITAGDKTKLASAQGVLQGDEYVCTLDISSVLKNAGQWYDIRLFFGDACTDLLKDSCIAYGDFRPAEDYSYNGSSYRFEEYNGILKIQLL